MSDMSFSWGIDSSGMTAGLSEAQRSATRFVAFMEGLNSKLEAVANKSVDVASAMASIGATSAAIRSELETLAATGASALPELQAKLGLTNQQMIAQVEGILRGGEKQIKSYELVADEIGKVTDKIIQRYNAEKKLAEYIALGAAQRVSRRDLQVAAGARPAKRVRDSDYYANIDYADDVSVDDLRIARRMQKLQRLTSKYQLQEQFPIPEIEMGEGKQAKNLERLSFALEKVREKIAEIKAQEQETFLAGEAHRRREIDRQKEVQRLLNEQVVAHKKIAAERAKVHAEQSRRIMDQMFIKGPDMARAKELARLGVISMDGIGQSARKSTRFVDRLFGKFERGTALATKGTLSLVRGLQNAQSTMALMTSSFAGLLAMLTGMSAGAFFKMSMDFEKAMLRVNLLVKEGESNLGKLTREAKELSMQFGLMPDRIAEGMRIAISSDVAPQEIKEFMEEAGKLAVAQNASVEKTADLLSMLKNAFNLTTKDMSRLRDMIFVMTDRGRTEVEQFASEIGKIAPTARLAGVNIQEMMAAFAGLSRTRSTEQAGTLLRNLFKNIIEPSGDARTQLKKLELGLTPAQMRANGFIETITKFRLELAKNPALLAEVAEDLRELAAWGELTDSQFQALVSTFAEMTNSVGLGDAKTKEMMESTEVKWNRLLAALKISVMELGDELRKTFGAWVEESGGVEGAMLKVRKWVKQTELAIRLMIEPLAFAMRVAERGAVAGELERLQDEIEHAQRNIDYMEKKGIKKDMFGLTLEGERKRMETAIERVNFLNEEVDRLVEAQNQKSRITQLGEDIAFLNNEIEENTRTWQANRAAREAAEKAKIGSQAPNAPTELDKIEALREKTQEYLEQTLKIGKDSLKNWVTDNRDMVTQTIANYRRLASEQQSVVKEMQRALKDLIKDQRAFDDSVQDTIEKLKDQDRSPDQQIQRLKDRGREMEKRANEAAKAGEREEVQRLLQQAMGYYEQILSVSNTKENRQTVISALERLKKGMDEVYRKEQESIQEKMATAQNAAAFFTEKANQVTLKFKEFEQGVRDVGRAVEDMGKNPDPLKLIELREKIRQLMEDSKYFGEQAADPLLSGMDKAIDKAKEFAAELKKAFDVGFSAEQLRALGSKSPEFQAELTKSNFDNQHVFNRITTVESLSVNVGSGAYAIKNADARRLAKDIKREIERGEAPALGGK